MLAPCWLPFYHDLGMFCGLLLPLLSGGCCNFMPPVHLISEPFRWLKIIHDYQANSVAAPDFAWELCASMVTDEGITQLDLSSVKMAMNAAEPIRAETMNRFASRFSATGFRPQSFTPVYGMAESTLAQLTDYIEQHRSQINTNETLAEPKKADKEIAITCRLWSAKNATAFRGKQKPDGSLGSRCRPVCRCAGGGADPATESLYPMQSVNCRLF
ncbi:hypothetical protein XBKQ1_470020 [Xenorhabdus bovienii str. kraussei Quebec]|uniref:AMP-dependent synthetase/ligase domain-containing protein n=1 Tax=Xenorhabdus bovienii str. kraussei Quebec TaxID=1398203 RepID=A0A077PKB8_XENBV|nr:AMP-binding protein [Xenorhabdus bovienii]CDH21488.1 hypothetical protein XBKQ1_470020 [Xenorhabdus bovienii str. kraussei Quebec]